MIKYSMTLQRDIPTQKNKMKRCSKPRLQRFFKWRGWDQNGIILAFFEVQQS